MQNEQRLVAPARYEAVGQSCQFVAQAAKSAGLDDQAVFHVQLAVDEAITNIIEHAYGGENRGDISITCGVEAGSFLILLVDQGQAFNPDTIPSPRLTLAPSELRIGGLGLHFMRTLMDRVEFYFRPGRNELLMFKQLDQDVR